MDVPCAACSKRQNLDTAIARRWRPDGNEKDWETTFTPDGLTAFKEANRGAPGVAKSAEHREAMSLAHVLLAKLTHPINACLLCELWVYERAWHARCRLRWMHYRKRHPDAPPEPPASSRRGPGGTNALRDFHLLLRRIAGDIRSELAKNADFAPHAGLNRIASPTRTAINRAIERFIKRLPGAWQFVFTAGSGSQHSEQSRSEHTARWRTKNERKRDILQKYVALPELIRQHVERGERNPLIRRLHHYEIPPGEIAELVGATIRHVNAVIAETAAGDEERSNGYRRRSITAPVDIAARIDAPREKLVPPATHRTPERIKLTAEQVKAIVEAPAKRGVITRLAEKYGLSPAWVSKIRRGKTAWGAADVAPAPQAANIAVD